MWLSISEVSQFGLSDLLTWPRSLLFLCPELVATSRRVVKMLDVLLNATGLQCYVANCKKWLGFYRQRLSNGSNLGDKTRELCDCYTSVILDSTPSSCLPRSICSTKKLTVALDLDETLVCAFRKSLAPHVLHSSGYGKEVRTHEISHGPGKEIESSAVGSIVVVERPGLEKFLSRLVKFSDVVVYTAGEASESFFTKACNLRYALL
mmetsp:Transcript_5058/g.12337  ORF Transcript_5058/g.12337 Transcript_5058/m.12337 type:complete len:207 (-) Transcript_5058:778-1398(-)